jgi:acyl-CoA thioesterase II
VSGEPVDRLLGVLDLARAGPDRFLGETGGEGGRRLFGGHVAAQALRAAALTARRDHRVSSSRAYFLRPGRFGPPVELAVERVRDGRSFTTRHVVARQSGETILTLDATCHRDEPGDEHQPPAPAVPPPDACPPLSRPAWMPRRPVDVRAVEGPALERLVWIRISGPVPDDPTLHACLLTYLTDMGPAGVARGSVGIAPGPAMSVSLDHCLWFHRPARADDWLLYRLAPVSASGARGLVTGSVWTRSGDLVATVAQEALIRPPR